MTVYRNVSAVPVDLPDGRSLGVGEDVDLPSIPDNLTGRLVATGSAAAAEDDARDEPQPPEDDAAAPTEPQPPEPAKKATHRRTKH